MQPSHKHHPQPQPAAQTPPPNAGPDINIPSPDTAPAPAPTTPSTATAPASMPASVPLAISSTNLVIAAVLIVVWAGLLIFARRLLSQSLIAQFADLGKSRNAGNALYLFLLALGATVIVCSLGNFWTALSVVIPASALDAVLLIVFLFGLASARASRQRR